MHRNKRKMDIRGNNGVKGIEREMIWESTERGGRGGERDQPTKGKNDTPYNTNTSDSKFQEQSSVFRLFFAQAYMQTFVQNWRQNASYFVGIGTTSISAVFVFFGSKSRHSLKLNILQAATDTPIVAIEGEWNRTKAFEWHQFQRPWVTFKPDFKIMIYSTSNNSTTSVWSTRWFRFQWLEWPWT